MTRYVFHPQATRELQDSIRWYEAQRSGLGGRFEQAVERTVSHIADHPLAFPRLRGVWRRALVSGFPYGIIYRPIGDTIYVLSCFHNSRNPREWRKRI